MGIRYTDNSESVLELLRQAVARACNDIGEQAAQYAADVTPVDTGRARNSVTYATSERQSFEHEYKDGKGNSFSDRVGQGVKEGEVYIGSNVEYFPYIENGSRTIDAYHPLQKAATEHGEEYKEIMENAMKNA